MSRAFQLALLCLLAPAVIAQSEAASTSKPGVRPPDALEDAARVHLDALAKARAGVSVLRCDYVQLRSSILTVEPLRSEGTLLFRRDPACVVFAVEDPRVAQIRLDRTTYQVFEPEKKRCERFELGESQLSNALFDALAVRVDALLDAFKVSAIVAVPADPERAIPAHNVIRLQPRPQPANPANEAAPTPPTEDARHWLQSLSLAVVAAAGESPARLHAVTYTDGQGDTVALHLSDLEFDPEDLAPDAFSAEVPAGTDLEVRRSSAGTSAPAHSPKTPKQEPRRVR